MKTILLVLFLFVIVFVTVSHTTQAGFEFLTLLSAPLKYYNSTHVPPHPVSILAKILIQNLKEEASNPHPKTKPEAWHLTLLGS